MDDEELAYLQSLERQREESMLRQGQMAMSNYASIGNSDPNLIEWQLELDNIKEELKHLLRGDILKEDKKGNPYYVSPDDDSLKPLNEYGVQFIMNILSSYLNRNTILSNYDEDRIYKILYDIGYEITDQIYLNAEKMGLDTPDKIKRYPMIVLQLIHTIESAYNRAYKGGERESLRSARIVTQSDNMNPSPIMMNMRKTQKTSLFNPSTWLK